MEYTVILHPAEEGGYWGKVPVLPSCFSQRETVEETLSNIKEVIESHLIALRKHTKDKVNFYYHSRGSLAETKSHLIYGHKVGYFSKPHFEEHSNLIDEIWKELNSLINSLSKKL